MSLSQTIQSEIAARPYEQPFVAADFRGLGSRAAVAQTLKRLADRGEILRVSRGLYVRPRRNRFVGAVMPDPHLVVEEIARRANETVQIEGAEAARRFGFSTQMPVVPTYLTSGRSREVHIRNLTIRLRKVSPRKLVLAGRPAGDALAALYYLGREGVTPEILVKLESKLPAEEFQALRNSRTSMPAWMAMVFQKHERSASRG